MSKQITSPKDQADELRERIAEVNRLIRSLAKEGVGGRNT